MKESELTTKSLSQPNNAAEILGGHRAYLEQCGSVCRIPCRTIANPACIRNTNMEQNNMKAVSTESAIDPDAVSCSRREVPASLVYMSLGSNAL